MTFGKPKQTDDPVRCIECGEEYRDKDIILKHAGRIEVHEATGNTEPGDYWNSKCPECGQHNSMRQEYAELSEKEFREEQHEVHRQRRKMIKEQKRELERRQQEDEQYR